MGRFSSTLGMHEMEVAAEIIMDKIEKTGSMATFTYGDFYDAKNDQAMTGYCELLHRGWLDRAMYNGQYTASAGLIERLTKKLRINPQDIPKYIPAEAKDEFELQMREFQEGYKNK